MLDVGCVMKRARKLLRLRVLKPIDLAIVDCLVFSCSQRGQDRACASYNSLARLIGAGRDAIIAGIKRLGATGLIAKHKQSRLVQWRYGGQAWRQMPNAYRILAGPAAPNCESDFPAALRLES